MISIKTTGSFYNTERFLEHATRSDIRKILEYYGEKGVAELSKATPLDSGKTSESWGYEIVRGFRKITIYWTNSNIVNGIPIAVILQYGHGTNHGGWVEGIDYINPAIRPIFEEIADNAWREVSGQ